MAISFEGYSASGLLVTFCVSRKRRRREMYIGHARLCLCVCVCLSVCLSVRCLMPTLLHGPGCNLRNGRGCPLVVDYWQICNRWTGFVAMAT